MFPVLSRLVILTGCVLNFPTISCGSPCYCPVLTTLQRGRLDGLACVAQKRRSIGLDEALEHHMNPSLESLLSLVWWPTAARFVSFL